jgi:hypothetical protein
LDLCWEKINKKGRDTNLFSKKYVSSLSEASKRGLKKLKSKLDEIVIRPSDKTNMTVILDRQQYCESLKEEIKKESQDFRILNMTKNGVEEILAKTERN